MSYLYAVIMGVIQGLTEFLPVSSSGHLAIFQILFGVEAPGMFFDVLLHIGTLIAVILCYYKDIGKMIVELFLMIADLFRRRKVVTNIYRKMDLLIIVATVPTGIIGVFNSDLIEKVSKLLIVPGICLIITGVILLLADRCPDGEKTPKTTSYSNAFLIGIAQGIATLPGISRSGSTITACLLSGFNRKYAVKFSFILSIPAILGSLVFELFDIDLSTINGHDMGAFLVGMVVAAVVGYISIRTMLLVVRKKKFLGFSIYCFIIGAASVIGYFLI